MPDDIKWIKISVGLFDDEKVRQIRSMPGGETMILLWLQLLLLAGRVNQDGLLVLSGTDIPYTEEMMATQFGVELKVVLVALETFRRFGMVDMAGDVFHITNWAKHQSVDEMDRIREQSRERVQRYRERQKNVLPAAEKPALPPAEKEPSPLDRRFARFWAAYPRKVGKGAAERSFKKYKPDDALTDTMIRAVEAAKQSREWKKDNGQFIPHPSTWLNQRRWEDEPPQEKPVRDDRGLEEWT